MAGNNGNIFGPNLHRALRMVNWNYARSTSLSGLSSPVALTDVFIPPEGKSVSNAEFGARVHASFRAHRLDRGGCLSIKGDNDSTSALEYITQDQRASYMQMMLEAHARAPINNDYKYAPALNYTRRFYDVLRDDEGQRHSEAAWLSAKLVSTENGQALTFVKTAYVYLMLKVFDAQSDDFRVEVRKMMNIALNDTYDGSVRQSARDILYLLRYYHHLDGDFGKLTPLEEDGCLSCFYGDYALSELRSFAIPGTYFERYEDRIPQESEPMPGMFFMLKGMSLFNSGHAQMATEEVHAVAAQYLGLPEECHLLADEDFELSDDVINSLLERIQEGEAGTAEHFAVETMLQSYYFICDPDYVIMNGARERAIAIREAAVSFASGGIAYIEDPRIKDVLIGIALHLESDGGDDSVKIVEQLAARYVRLSEWFKRSQEETETLRSMALSTDDVQRFFAEQVLQQANPHGKHPPPDPENGEG